MAPSLRKKTPPDPKPKRRAILASAASYDLAGGQTWKAFTPGDTRWQREAWRQYDICAEYRFGVTYVGNVISQATLYAAVVDPDTGRPGEPADDPTVTAVVEGILGGPAKRPQAQKTIAVNRQVPGEVFIVVRDTPDGDQWIVLSTSEISGGNGGVEYCDPATGGMVKLTGSDLLIRLWNRHPQFQLHADSNTRALLPILAEIERSSQNIATRLDSRLASNGLLIVPSEMDFPTGDDDPPGAQGLMAQMAASFTAGIQDPTSAAAQVPIVLEAPGELIANITHLTLDSDVTSETTDLRKEAIARLAVGMDIPVEVITGVRGMNHWGAWQVEESTYKAHVAPMLDWIADGLTAQYLHPVLQKAGVADPEQYMLAWDVSDIVVRPNRLADLLSLHERGLVSDDAVRLAAGVSNEEKPTRAESLARLAEEWVKAAPTLLRVPEIAQLIGIEPVRSQIAETGGEVVVTPSDGDPELEAGPPSEEPDGPPAVAASAVPSSGSADLLAADIAVLHALARVGGRLLNSHSMRGRYSETPKHEIHTQVAIEADRIPALLDGAFEFCGDLAETRQLFRYVGGLLESGAAHDRGLLAVWMADHG